MGLTFYYSGRIRDYKEIDTLVDEVADLCKGLNWSYTIIADEELKGILINAPGSEPLWFMFTPDGRTCSIVNLKFCKPDDPFFSTIHVKTQYAGPEVHMALIKMLRYMSEKYFSEIEVMDEGEFWEKGDEENLRRIFANYTGAINMFTEMLEKLDRIPGESAEALAVRIEQMVKENGIDGVEIVRITDETSKEE